MGAINDLSDHAQYVIVGAGIHGLSTAWHLARRLGDEADVLVLDKTRVAAGASGIACGVIRNNYFQPAMRRLMAHSVAVWESDPAAFSYHPVGYLQAAGEFMAESTSEIHSQQTEIGYESTLVEGAGACRDYLRRLFGDWRAPGITNVLHEKRGGFANNQAALAGLAAKARQHGARIAEGVSVRGFDITAGAVRAVETDHGRIGCDQLIVAAGPWLRDLWGMLELPDTIAVRGGVGHIDTPMWRYMLLREGTLGVDPSTFTTADGGAPPVMHVDSDAPLRDDTGEVITTGKWGVYYKPDFGFAGIQGGAMPLPVDLPASEVAIDPYGPHSTDYAVDESFARMWTAALAHCHERFDVGSWRHLYRQDHSGGLGCFTPDSFPVFDTVRDNAYVIADSNHGYKMLGVGALVAGELLGGTQELLEPFRLSRFANGDTHPVSDSPFPWS